MTKHKNNYNYVVIILIICLGLITIIGGTYAVFNGYIDKTLGYLTSSYGVEIIEESDTGFGKREISFLNKGTSPVLLRISYNEIWSKEEDEQTITYNNLLNSDTAVTKEWTENFLNDFTLYDGWYYYNKLLNPNASINVLKRIKLQEYSDNWDYDYRDLDYELAWNYEAIQAKESAINTVWKINCKIEGDNVKWEF